MRILKFRLRIGRKIVGYERWYIGDGSNSHWEYCKNPDGEYLDIVWRPTYIYHTEKDQYIGLKDKNKKEIYKEDILLDIQDRKWLVYWRNGWASFFLQNLKNEKWQEPMMQGNVLLVKIIGNIYENPELLKGNKSERVNRENDCKIK